MALAGDLGALRLCLDRLAPRPRDMPLAIKLPRIETAEDALEASIAVMSALATGEVTPSEASQAMASLVNHVKIVDSCVHERQLTEIQEILAERDR